MKETDMARARKPEVADPIAESQRSALGKAHAGVRAALATLDVDATGAWYPRHRVVAAKEQLTRTLVGLDYALAKEFEDAESLPDPADVEVVRPDDGLIEE